MTDVSTFPLTREVPMNELLQQIEAAIEGRNMLWLLRQAPESEGYFANICTDDREAAGGFSTFPANGRTPEQALRAAFALYKASLS